MAEFCLPQCGTPIVIDANWFLAAHLRYLPGIADTGRRRALDGRTDQAPQCTWQHVDVLTGRAALVTGANRGLGLEIARAFVSAGASVMLCARDAGPCKSPRQDGGPGNRGQVVCWRMMRCH